MDFSHSFTDRTETLISGGKTFERGVFYDRETLKYPEFLEEFEVKRNVNPPGANETIL